MQRMPGANYRTGTADLVSRNRANAGLPIGAKQVFPRTIRSQAASPSGSQTTVIIQLVTHRAVLAPRGCPHAFPRHRTIDHHGIAPGRGLFHDRYPHAQFDTEPMVGVAVAVPPHSPSTVSGSISRETVALPTSIGRAVSVPCPSEMTERTTVYCTGASPPTTPVTFDATKAVFSSKPHSS